MEVSEIKKYMRHGDMKLIAQMSGSHRQTVYSTLNGKPINKVVLRCAEIVAKRRKEQLDELAKKDYLNLDKES